MKTAYDTNESYYGGIMGFYAAAETALETPVYNTAPIGGDAVTNAPDSYVTEFEKVERTLPLVVDQANIIPDDVENALIAQSDPARFNPPQPKRQNAKLILTGGCLLGMGVILGAMLH